MIIKVRIYIPMANHLIGEQAFSRNAIGESRAQPVRNSNANTSADVFVRSYAAHETARPVELWCVNSHGVVEQ